jgi:hypothetical protein
LISGNLSSAFNFFKKTPKRDAYPSSQPHPNALAALGGQ